MNFINATDIEEFLQEHPDFFISRKRLFSQMQWPQEIDPPHNATSIADIQIKELHKTMRNYNTSSQKEQKIAKINENVHRQFNLLYQQLFKVRDIEQLHDSLQSSLVQFFDLHYSKLIIENDNQQVFQALRVCTKQNSIYCGRPSDNQEQALLQLWPTLEKIGSVAIIPIQYLGFWVIASENEDYYNSDQNTLLLDLTSQLIYTVVQQVS